MHLQLVRLSAVPLSLGWAFKEVSEVGLLFELLADMLERIWKEPFWYLNCVCCV